MRNVLAILKERAPKLEVDGEMHGDAALDEEIRLAAFPNSSLKGQANLLVMPTLDAANISFNLLKVAAGDNLTVGPILLGCCQAGEYPDANRNCAPYCQYDGAHCG
jgi:malate dehydrogenase (oxaloacetate-decarboxylating)(NADP+)